MPERKMEKLLLDTKIKIGIAVAEEGLSRFARPAIVWSGGKDSTTTLSLVRTASENLSLNCPPCLFVDHGLHFKETWEFINELKDKWNLRLIVAKNEDLLNNVRGDKIVVNSLSDESKQELAALNYKDDFIPYSLSSEIGNHLLKTAPLKEAILRYKFDALFVGIRWDENEARSSETFLSWRADPEHYRLHPILLFTERDIWNYILKFGIPKHPLYSKGYRSIDDIEDSLPTSSVPAWEQDLEGSSERAGRSQNKEQMMDRLRKLGYM